MTRSKFGFLQSVSPAPAKGTRATSATTAAPVTRGPGRPPGKRSDPTYGQLTVWIRKQTHDDARLKLARLKHAGKPLELSELVEDLLSKWLQSHPEKP